MSGLRRWFVDGTLAPHVQTGEPLQHRRAPLRFRHLERHELRDGSKPGGHTGALVAPTHRGGLQDRRARDRRFPHVRSHVPPPGLLRHLRLDIHREQRRRHRPCHGAVHLEVGGHSRVCPFPGNVGEGCSCRKPPHLRGGVPYELQLSIRQ